MRPLTDFRPVFRPWLMIGKGPSADRIADVALTDFDVCTLNDAIKLVPRAQLAHFIDVEVYDRCAELLLARADYIAIPDVLHRACKPALPAGVFIASRGDLRALDAAGRIVVYKRWARTLNEGEPPEGWIACRYFSSEAALGILGALGARIVRTIGIDGGSSYAKAFEGLTPLQNGRTSFDVQGPALDAIAARHGIDLVPMFTRPAGGGL